MKVHLFNSKKKKIVFATIILLSVAVLTFGLLSIIYKPKKSTDNIANTKQNITNESVKAAISEFSEIDMDSKAKSDNAPTSGELIYEAAGIYENTKTGVIRYLYYTPEKNKDRLIELNDLILEQLKDSGQINEQTESYYIDYFSDKDTAKSYFDSTDNNGKKISTIEKIRQLSQYTASMTYSKKLNANMLISISIYGTKLLKSY